MNEQRIKLEKWIESQIKIAKENNEPFFLNHPDSWYEPHPVYGDENGHISTRYLKSEQLNDNVCLECNKPVYFIPSNTTEEILEKILS